MTDPGAHEPRDGNEPGGAATSPGSTSTYGAGTSVQVTDWDLRKLRVLRALSELGTVRATAEALCMTPSAVSQQLSSLAQEVGTPLLEAQGRGVDRKSVV